MEYELGKKLEMIENLLYAIAEKVGVLEETKEQGKK